MNSHDNLPASLYAGFALLFLGFALHSIWTGRTLRSSRFSSYTRANEPIRYYTTVLIELGFVVVGIWGFVSSR
jgi:hypothetical protein